MSITPTDIKKVIPKAKTLHDKVHADMNHLISTYKSFLEQIGKSTKRRAYVESYLLSWTYIEQVLLPSLIRQIAHQVGLKEIPNLDNRFVSHIIDHYYFLSHDTLLYKKLCDANKQRVKIIHGIKTSEDILSINKKARFATKFVLKQITVPIIDRLKRDSVVPVLSLYSRGWNDCRTAIGKKLNSLIE